MNRMVQIWSHELDYLRAVHAAAKNLISNSPIGDDDKPYASEVTQAEVKALAEAISSPYWSMP